MKTLRSILSAILSLLMAAPSAQALPNGAQAGAPVFNIFLPKSLGYISEAYSSNSRISTPDIILIQDLHVNRSVQFAISGILKRLKRQGLMPAHIAVEGDTGPIEIKTMQRYPDPLIRKQAADYLVQQGEMPGAMHFAISEGEGGLFGIETDEYYQANLEMFRRSYAGRNALRQELEKIRAVLPRLKQDAATRYNAAILDKDVEAVSQLINNQVIPDELPATLAAASAAVERLQLVLPKESAAGVIEPLAASVDFYALALLRDEELFKNAMAVREMGRQETTIVVTGGFHTQALARQCKRQGLSYAVITPNVKRHNKIDERLYIERLMDRHLTPEQAATGQDWAAMQMIMVGQIAGRLWGGVTGQIAGRRGWRPTFRHSIALTIAALALFGQVVSAGGPPPQQPVSPGSPVVSQGQPTESAARRDSTSPESRIQLVAQNPPPQEGSGPGETPARAAGFDITQDLLQKWLKDVQGPPTHLEITILLKPGVNPFTIHFSNSALGNPSVELELGPAGELLQKGVLPAFVIKHVKDPRSERLRDGTTKITLGINMSAFTAVSEDTHLSVTTDPPGGSLDINAKPRKAARKSQRRAEVRPAGFLSLTLLWGALLGLAHRPAPRRGRSGARRPVHPQPAHIGVREVLLGVFVGIFVALAIVDRVYPPFMDRVTTAISGLIRSLEPPRRPPLPTPPAPRAPAPTKRVGPQQMAMLGMMVALVAAGVAYLGTSTVYAAGPAVVMRAADSSGSLGSYSSMLGFGAYPERILGVMGMALVSFRAWRSYRKQLAALTIALYASLKWARFKIGEFNNAIFAGLTSIVVAPLVRINLKKEKARLHRVAHDIAATVTAA